MKQYLLHLRPYWGIALFVCSMLLANVLWKASVRGDETDQVVTLWGQDVSAAFSAYAQHTAVVACGILNNLGLPARLGARNTIWCSPDFTMHIVWSCAPLKQMFIWLVIMLFALHRDDSYRGVHWWINKIAYALVGCVLIEGINIARIVAIGLLCSAHPEQFVFWHGYVLKYLFYLILFCQWLGWEHLRGAGSE